MQTLTCHLTSSFTPVALLQPLEGLNTLIPFHMTARCRLATKHTMGHNKLPAPTTYGDTFHRDIGLNKIFTGWSYKCHLTSDRKVCADFCAPTCSRYSYTYNANLKCKGEKNISDQIQFYYFSKTVWCQTLPICTRFSQFCRSMLYYLWLSNIMQT